MLTLISKVDQTINVPYDSINISQVAGDPLGKATFKVLDSGAQLSLQCLQEVILCDESVALTPNIVVPTPWVDSFSTDTVSTSPNYLSLNAPGGSTASWTFNLQTGGSSATALSTFMANAASSTIATADKLYTTSGSPTSVNTLTTINGSTGWGEVPSQGSASAWPSLGAIGNPSGKGFFLDASTLDGMQFPAGNWSGNVRISANGSGTITADLVVRVYRYTPGTSTYTNIITWTLPAQSWTTTINTASLPSTAASAITFATGDRLYIDYWAHVTANTSGTGQQIRMNRLSTDTTTFTGDPATQITTPGYRTPPTPGNLTTSGGHSALLLLNNWTAQSCTVSATMTSSDFGGLLWNVANTSNYYEVVVCDASSPTPNVVQMYKTVNGIRVGIGPSALIAFTRGTSHTISVIAANSSGSTTITVSFDGAQILSYTDASPLGPGMVGLRSDMQSGHSSAVFTAFSATSNDVATLTTSVPAHNYLKNNNFNYGSNGWTVSGSGFTFPSNPTFGPAAMATLTYSNTAVGTTTAYQNAAKIYGVPGQQYCFSGYLNITQAFSNANFYIQITFVDGAGVQLAAPQQTYTADTNGITRVSITATAPANTVTVQANFGGHTTNATNSGMALFTALQLEPVWFPTLYTYPSPICDFLQSDCITLPDATATRYDRIFTGNITHLTATYEGSTRIWDVEATSLDGLLENATLVNASYAGVTDQSIITGIVNNLSPRLLYANDSTLATGTPQALAYRNVPICYAGVNISSMQYADATLREVINSLTDITGFLSGVDPYYNCYYYPPFYNAAPYGFSQSPDNVTTFPFYDYSVEYDGTQIQNSLKVSGATYQLTVTETWHSQDGSHTEYTSGGLTYAFVPFHSPAQTPTLTVGGTSYPCQLDTGTAIGSPQGLYNPDLPLVQINPSAAVGAVISMTYTYNALVYVLVQSPDSIGQYGRPLYSKINDTNLASNASAAARGEAQLQEYAQPRITLKFKTQKLLHPGQVIEITSTLDGFTKAHFAVQRVTATYLGHGVNQYEIEAGTYIDDFVDFFRNTQKAVNRVDHNPAEPIKQYNNLQQDTVTYTDALNIHT